MLLLAALTAASGFVLLGFKYCGGAAAAGCCSSVITLSESLQLLFEKGGLLLCGHCCGSLLLRR